ncbi:hypothetical protein EAS61_40200 [Bradyrhizobium zhanjiangense]|uniref:Uncharacterized protein n=1 Tax=Bradyrhizobium zhanjiangense TaxID=1325107 RepID=A0A4Q0Q5Y7_9BRAD|nr:hypothetical protein EAS61_40200 [Bradyrhizobium zhanjiangense]
MAGLVPAIHVLAFTRRGRTWMPGTSPGMTSFFAGAVGLTTNCTVHHAPANPAHHDLSLRAAGHQRDPDPAHDARQP